VRALRVAVVSVVKAEGLQNGALFVFVVLAVWFCYPGGPQGEL
jgi:hypothetical protein